jgi:hypothetical protein
LPVLWVLKILGFIILGIVALVVFIALLLLFIPIYYKADLNYNGQLNFDARASWLLRIFKLTFRLKGKESESAFTIFGHKPEHKDKDGASSTGGDTAGRIDSNTSAGSGEPDGKPSPSNVQPPPKLAMSDSKSTAKAKAREHKKKPKKKSGGLWGKFQQVHSYKYKKLLIKRTILLLRRWLRVIAPVHYNGTIKFGTDDPSLTGSILGAYSAIVLPWGVERHVELSVDFEKKALYIDLHADGRVQMWAALWPFLSYIFSKPVWSLIRPHVHINFRRRAQTNGDNSEHDDSRKEPANA